jgi:iron(III) transport system ATP-binding protein
MDDSYLNVKIVSKKFSGTEILNGIEFSLHRGEVLCLMGASGSGKTTLARCIAGFEQFEGNIVLNSKDITHVHPRSRRVGIVPQDGALFPHLNVEGNIGFGIKDKNIRKEKIRKLLEIVELDQIDGILKKKVDQLSGGQQQRVAVARALSSDPEVIILDESFTSLDQWLRATVRKQILNSIKKTNTTVIVITHDIAEAFELGDRVGVIDSGKLVQIGSSSEIYSEPVNLEVAKLVGSANILSFDETNFGANFKDFTSKQEDLDAENKVLMLRPEHIVLAGPDSDLRIPAKIVDIKVNGPLTDVFLSLEDRGDLLVSSNQELAGKNIGDEVEISFSDSGIVYKSEFEYQI